VAPVDATPLQRLNFLNVQIDAIGIGIASAAAQFLPIFFTRLGATNFQVGLLTAMPALSGLVLAIIVGRFLQTRRQIVPWFSVARLLVISAYALTGLVPFFVPEELAVPAVLLIWLFATIPQIVVNVAFSVVMNAVAGPAKRYELMSRRWSLLGLTTALTVAITGQVLDRLDFPINYQIVFMGLSLGGLISYYFSSHIRLPDAEVPPGITGLSLGSRLKENYELIKKERPFLSFNLKRFVFLTGQSLAIPLFPLYYVRVLQASNSWIGLIATAQTSVMLIGYFFWTRQSRRRGSRFVLLWTTLGLSLFPAMVASTRQIEWIVVIAGLGGILQAGIDLVFFDELMKTVPEESCATFVSYAQSIQYLSSFIAPLIGTSLATWIGIPGAMLVSTGIRLLGFALFAYDGEIQLLTQLRRKKSPSHGD
jgi:Na+/melibiose symporter-like transporter